MRCACIGEARGPEGKVLTSSKAGRVGARLVGVDQTLHALGQKARVAVEALYLFKTFEGFGLRINYWGVAKSWLKTSKK